MKDKFEEIRDFFLKDETIEPDTEQIFVYKRGFEKGFEKGCELYEDMRCCQNCNNKNIVSKGDMFRNECSFIGECENRSHWVFAKPIKRMTEDELKRFYYSVEDCNVQKEIVKEIIKRIRNGTLEPNYKSGKDWDILVCNCHIFAY